MKKLIISLSCLLIVASIFFVNINNVNASEQMHYIDNQIHYKGVTNINNVEINVNNEVAILTDGFSSELYGTYDNNVSTLPYSVYYYREPTNTQPNFGFTTRLINTSTAFHSSILSNESSVLYNPSYDTRFFEYGLRSSSNYVFNDLSYTFNYNDLIISDNYRDLCSGILGNDGIFAFYVAVWDSNFDFVGYGNAFNVESTLSFELYDVNKSSQSVSYNITRESFNLQGINVFFFDFSSIPNMSYYYIINPTLTVHYTELSEGETYDICFLDSVVAQDVSNDTILDLVPSLLMYKGFDNSLDFLQFYKQVNIDSINLDVDFTSWITNSVTSFLDTDILGIFSISDILMFILALGLTIMMIKFFMGG